jgi:serine/threonine protein kinase
MGKCADVRKALGVVVAVLALAGGGFGSRAMDTARAKAVRVQTDRAAVAAGARSADALSTIASDLKFKADNAAANPRLVFALQGNVDEPTMHDLWRTEEWWRPWRTEFKVYAVAMSGPRLDVVEGVSAADLDVAGLLRHVRDRGEAVAEMIAAKGRPYAAAATLVAVPGRDRSPVLLLAKPVDQAMLRRLADQAGNAVLLTDGRASLIDAGPVAERTRLARAIGSENRNPLFHAADGTWVAAATQAGPGLWLWTFTSASAAMHDAQAAAAERKLMLWGLVALVAGASLVLGFRQPQPADPNTRTDPHVSFHGETQLGVAPLPGTFQGQGPLSPPGERGTVELAGPNPSHSSPGLNATPFGRYMLLERLGQGGMAEVYTAVSFGAEGFRRKFVIKRLRAELARDQGVVDQFIDEANLASSMVHSNIVPVFDFGKVGEEYFLAQEYILGRDLARVTRRHLERDGQPLPAQVMLYAAHETLKALEYAHTKISEAGQPLGIVHRDVSPTNVIVSARGEVKLFDFGIVKAEGRVSRTQSGVVKGNVTFMSPEQARGVNVDARADLFSLGLLLYYCLAGQVLYTGNTTYELLVKAATGPGPAEFNQMRALPDPCGALLERALQVKPGDRFQTAREFADAIADHIGGGASELAKLMDHLFSEDFKEEEARFRTLGPPDQPVAGSELQATSPRRT